MRYSRTFIQYGELVFDEVYADDYGVAFKQTASEYGASHGSYMPQKRKGGLLSASSVTMSLIFRMRKLPCDLRPFYHGFVKSQLTSQGKLWAVQHGALLWTNAILVSYYERSNAFTGDIELDVEFALPDGIWHKADKQRTFLLPYDICDLMECYEFQELQPCVKTDCCNCAPAPQEACDCCPPCDEVLKEHALCYNLDKVKDFVCGPPDFKVKYDCLAAEKFFGDFKSDERLGQKFCTTCGEIIAGQFYSETDLPTDNIKITIRGKVSNPYIEINGNGNYIQGEYDGVLEIYGNGEMYFGEEGCEVCEPLPVDKWVIPPGMNYGWTVEPGKNRLTVDGGACCFFCVYVEVDAITI